MKSLYETFTDREFNELKRAKHNIKNGAILSWRRFLLKVARDINSQSKGNRE